MKNLFLSFLVLACGQPAFAQQEQQKLEKLFRVLEQDSSYNGNVLIADKGRIIFKKSIGAADLNIGRRLDDQSLFELASVSKQFTATGILLLQQQGKLKVGDSLRKFFPELPYHNITVLQLLHHTSGLPDYMELLLTKGDTTLPFVSNDDVIRLMAREKPALKFSPGTKFEYSNTGYLLLGSIIEKASGMSFAAYLEQHIFRPLGMKRSRVYMRRSHPQQVDDYAYGYVPDAKTNSYVLPDSSENKNYVIYMDGIYGDGTVNTTTGDLLLWDQALYSDKLLNRASLQLAFEPGTTGNGQRTRYACGWVVDTSDNLGLRISHSGGWPGYITYISRFPDRNKTVVLLRNKETKLSPSRLAEDIELILSGKDAVYNLPGPAVSEDILQQYVGDYELRPGFVLSVTREGQQLAVQATDQPKFNVYPKSQKVFFLKDVVAEVEFVATDGSVDSMVLHQGGRHISGKRKK